jgi:hypothetical protein
MLLVPEKSDSSIAGTSGWWGPAVEYMIDAGQRSVLYWDTMRQRGNSFREKAKTVTHVPEFASELVLDRRELDRPINYGLVRIIPQKPSSSIRIFVRSARRYNSR